MTIIRPTTINARFSQPVGLGGEKLWLCPTLGGDRLDLSGNGSHGTYNGGMGTVADKYKGDRAYRFDGSNDSIDVDNGSSFGGHSIACWIYANTTSLRIRFIDSYDRPTTLVPQVVIQHEANQGIRVFSQISGSASVLYVPINSHQWYHVASVLDGYNLKFYIDGSLNQEVAYTATPNVDWVRVGARNNNQERVNGKVDDVRVFSRALSPSEIKHLASYRGVLGSPRQPYDPLKRTVVRVPAAIPAATVVGSFKKPTTIIKPSYQAGYARNASESENPKLWDGLVGAWMPSLGVTGETLRDVSGNGNHGTLTNMDAATDWVATSKGLALDFDGTGYNYVESQDSIDAMGSSPRTLSSSFEIRSTANQAIAGFGNNSSSQWFYILIYQGKWYFSGYANDYSISQPLPVVGQHHVSMSYDSSDVRFFLDGLLIAQFAKTLNTQSGVLRIGNRAGFNDFSLNGQVNSVCLHNRALSPQEIKQLYVDSLAPFRRKQRVSVAVPAAVAPSATYHPLRSLAHPLEQ